MRVHIERIEQAVENLSGVIRKTDLIHCQRVSDDIGVNVFLKAENLQKTGSFKIRGAYNKLVCLSDQERKKGVIASSAGNHAQGVALAATDYGIKSTIVMPLGTPLAKVSATKNFGAQVVLHGNVYDEAYQKALEIQQQTKATFIHPFDDDCVIAGQGTIGIEIMDDLPEVDAVIVPIGGGGLISGIASAIKAIKPSVKVIGVESAHAASMYQSVKSKSVVTLNNVNTLADGIAVKTPGELTFSIVRDLVDDIVTVEEDEIANAILTLLEKQKIIAEGAGAAAFASLLYDKINLKGKNVVAVVSGGNIDVNMLARIIDKGLVKAGRKVELKTIIPDKPGQLQKLLQNITKAGANIVSVYHNRLNQDIPIGYAEIELVLETNDQKHIHVLIDILKEKGYMIPCK
ncbi:MAG: threonine ammonia-lyase [Clostridia bacterium]|nr:threonine ammonia-lyase [Clostridia bacterium]